jgi:hypothetical protein
VRSELDLRDRTAALTQAFCLGVTGAKASRGRHTELAMLVVNYFRVYLMSNRFRLRRPSIFLKRVVDLDTPTMENACGILVAAAEATDYQISAGFLSVLNKHVALGSN